MKKSMNRGANRLKQRDVTFNVLGKSEKVSGILQAPQAARALFVMAHGAGAGMRHPFLEQLAENLMSEGIASFRYQFPYMEKRLKRPDPPPVLLATVRAAVETAQELAPYLPLVAGGKSMGGRMTSLAASEQPLAGVKGIAFVGFPLHPPGAPSTTRSVHLSSVGVPMLFLQGTRDKLADLNLLKPVCTGLGRRATLHILEGADHSFHLPKSGGRSDDDALKELAHIIGQWVGSL